MADSLENKRRKTDQILKDVGDMSSKFSEVGRSIVFAVIAGCWVVYDKLPFTPKIFLQLSVLFAFLYLIIDFLYYGSTMVRYNDMLSFDDKKPSVLVKDENEAFRVQQKLRKRFFDLTKLKIVMLLLSILSLLVSVFYKYIC